MKKRKDARLITVMAIGALYLSCYSSSYAETRALLVGAWKFANPQIPDLKGPENDLAAMDTLMRSEGASDVTVLRNDQVSRTTVETALHALGLRAKPGDWIVFYYSGHGAEAHTAVKGTRDGDLDQFVPLPGFDQMHPDAERFIVDKDFYAWLSRYIPPSVKVLMIADTCHSGTMNRSVDPALFHFVPRLAFRGDADVFDLVARPAPQFPAVLPDTDAAAFPMATPDRPDLPNVIFVGAAQDDQVAWEHELPVTGAPSRGFLTYSFEQGLTARSVDGKTLVADANGDGKISVGELAIYLDSQVRGLSGERQKPRTSFVSGNENLALFAQFPARAPLAPQSPLPGVFSAQPGAQALLATGDHPWTVATSAAQADFLWDARTGKLVRQTGDTVAQGVTGPAQLRGALEKWRAIGALRPYMNETRAQLVIGPQTSGARYGPDALVNVALKHAQDLPASTYVTIFDLTSLGTVQLLYPVEAADGDGKLGPGGAMPVVNTQAVAPYGADHVVALVTAAPPMQFRALLQTLNNQPAAMQVVEPIRKVLADPAAQARLSIAEIYTGS